VLDGVFLKRRTGLLKHLELSGAAYAIRWEMDTDTGLLRPGAMAGRSEFLDASRVFCFRPGEGLVGKAYAGLLPGSCAVVSDMRMANQCEFYRKQDALLSGIESVACLSDAGMVFEFGYDSAPEEGLATRLLAIVQGQGCYGRSFRRTDSFSTDSTTDECGWDSVSSVSSTPQCHPSRRASFSSDVALDECAPDDVSCVTCASPSSGSPCGDIDIYIAESTTCELSSGKMLSVSCTTHPRTRSPSPVSRDDWWPTKGSIGHPYSCQAPCRFQHRGKGCKDGSSCDKCHLCRFTRAAARQKGVQRP